MKKYSTILFDLDGTLTDSSQGIINSIIYALKKYDINDYDMTVLRFTNRLKNFSVLIRKNLCRQ